MPLFLRLTAATNVTWKQGLSSISKSKKSTRPFLHLKKKDSATVHFICCNFHVLFQIFIAQVFVWYRTGARPWRSPRLWRSTWGRIARLCQLQYWSTLLSCLETTKCVQLYNMYSANLRIYLHDVHTGRIKATMSKAHLVHSCSVQRPKQINDPQ